MEIKVSKVTNDKINSKEVVDIDLTWQPLSQQWQNKLLSEKFVVKVNSLENDLANALNNAGFKTTIDKLKKQINKLVGILSYNSLLEVLQSFKEDQKNDQMIGTWNPFSIRNKGDFCKIIKTDSFSLEDDASMHLLSKTIKTDVVLLKDDYTVQEISDNDNLNRKVLIMMYSKSSHSFMLVGLRSNNKVQTVFVRDNLPKEIDILLDRHTFLLQHTKDIYNSLKTHKPITLESLLNGITNRVGTKLSKDDKQEVIKILRSLLERDGFFEHKKRQT